MEFCIMRSWSRGEEEYISRSVCIAKGHRIINHNHLLLLLIHPSNDFDSHRTPKNRLRQSYAGTYTHRKCARQQSSSRWPLQSSHRLHRLLSAVCPANQQTRVSVCPRERSACLRTRKACWDVTRAMEGLSTLWMGSSGTARGVRRRMGLGGREVLWGRVLR